VDEKYPFDTFGEATAAAFIALGQTFLDELGEIRKKPYSEEERTGFWKRVHAKALETAKSRRGG
jgi:hypothetical protein